MHNEIHKEEMSVQSVPNATTSKCGFTLKLRNTIILHYKWKSPSQKLLTYKMAIKDEKADGDTEAMTTTAAAEGEKRRFMWLPEI